MAMRGLNHLTHAPPSPPKSYDPLNSDLQGAIWATLSLVIVAVLILVGIGGCFARLICALQPDEDKKDKKDKTETTTSAPVAPAGMPTISKLAHVLTILVSGVIALAVSSVLADGTSVIRLKSPRYLPIVTHPDMKPAGINYRLDELLGPTYGVGLHHDQAGHTWTSMAAGSTLSSLVANLGIPVIAAALPSVIETDDLKHPVPFLECKNLQTAGLAAMGFGFIAESVAVLMVLFHALALAGLLPSSKAKPLAALVWLVLTAGFLIVVLLAIGIYVATWTCDNPIIPSIKLNDHFDYNYGFAFAIIGFVCSLLMFCVQIFCTSTKDDATFSPPAKLGAKVGCGVVSGMTIGAVAAIIVLACNDYFADAKPRQYYSADGKPTDNPCEGKKPYSSGPGDRYFDNKKCMNDNIVQVLEQAGANVTKGYRGKLHAGDRIPITESYDQVGLCPVNVHWHLGAEHLSAGEFDEKGSGPTDGGNLTIDHDDRRRLASPGSEERLGFRCHHYKKEEERFTKPYHWEHCTHMKIGETYEIHWPHSAAGACGTPYQYQTPFYDGVFCHDGIITIAPLNTYEKIGVQSQVFTIVNDDDDSLYYPNLIDGMIMSGEMGRDIAKYTGSTTGTTRDNVKCSRYTPITWQVDRKCHVISARSFDKLCQDMLKQEDDMSGDVYPHGARELVADQFVANNQQSRK